MSDVCPSADDLSALLEPDAEVPEAIESHVADCEKCQQRLDALSASVAVVSDFVAAIEPPDPEIESKPELQTAIENAKTRSIGFSPKRKSDEPPNLDFLEPPVDPDHLGQLGGFDVVELIAEGGMGLVFRGRDRDLERDIAIKVLSPALSAQPGARDLFLSEARAAASLDHENILPIHLVETSHAVPFLVMPLVRGGTLHDRLKSGEPLDFENEVLPVALAAARALAVAHQSGLIHRDVKPANLMLESSGEGDQRVWLADFGLARAMEESAPESGAPKMVVGTPHFLAPELLDGRPASERSDLFALGAVFYAMAAGRLPFSGKNTTEVMAAVRKSDPAPLAELNPKIPEWFSDLTARLLAKDPGERIETAKALVDQLESHAENRRAAAIRAPLLQKLRRIAAAILILAILIAGAVATLDLSGRTSLVNAFRARSQGEPFGIRGHWGVYPTLAEAADAAPSGATIEIFHDGRLAVAEVKIRKKSLIIEAARGFAPTLVNEGGNAGLISIEDGDLALRDLALQQNISAGLKVWPVIRVRRGSLTMEHFSLRRPGAPKSRSNPVGIRRPAFIELIDCPEAIFRNGYAQAKLSAFLFVSTRSDGEARTIVLENCFTVGSQLASFMGNPAYSAPVEMRLERCTGIHRVPFLVARNFGPDPVSIELNRSAINAGEAFLWAPTRRAGDLPNLVNLGGSGNLLAIEGPRFINLNPAPMGSSMPTEGTPTNLSEFRELWRLPEDFADRVNVLLATSVLLPLLNGEFEPTETFEFSEESGLPSPDLGADSERIGPRRP